MLNLPFELIEYILLIDPVNEYQMVDIVMVLPILKRLNKILYSYIHTRKGRYINHYYFDCYYNDKFITVLNYFYLKYKRDKRYNLTRKILQTDIKRIESLLICKKYQPISITFYDNYSNRKKMTIKRNKYRDLDVCIHGDARIMVDWAVCKFYDKTFYNNLNAYRCEYFYNPITKRILIDYMFIVCKNRINNYIQIIYKKNENNTEQIDHISCNGICNFTIPEIIYYAKLFNLYDKIKNIELINSNSPIVIDRNNNKYYYWEKNHKLIILTINLINDYFDINKIIKIKLINN